MDTRIPFHWGRKNKNYAGPTRALPSEHQIRADAMSIATEYDTSTNRAAAALYRGDLMEYETLLQKCAGLYSAHQMWSHLIESFPDREREQQRWAQNYLAFRHASGLASHNPNKVMSMPVNEEQLQDTINTVRMTLDDSLSITGRNIDDVYARVFSDDPEPETPDIDADYVPLDDDEMESLSAVEPPDHDAGEMPVYDESDVPEDILTPPPVSGTQSRRTESSIPLPMTPPEDYTHDRADNHPPRARSRSTPPKTADIPRSRRPRPNGAKGVPENASSSDILSHLEKSTGLDRHGSFRVTWRPRIGPFVFNMGRKGLVSVSVGSGGMKYRIWSRDYTPGLSSVDLPGGMSFRGKRTRK